MTVWLVVGLAVLSIVVGGIVAFIHKGYRLPLLESFRKHPWLCISAIVAAFVLYPSFFSTISFLFAETPEEAAWQGRSMPGHWSAGVMNHGEYYEWYTVSDRPVLFAISIIGLVLSVGYLWILCFPFVAEFFKPPAYIIKQKNKSSQRQ